jgi:hypothetical protein
MDDKTASSQAAWALITEGVTRARIDAHRLRHLIDRGLHLIEDSEHREHFYQMAGDLIMGVPERLQSLELALDRTSLALSKMGESFLEARLPLSDKTMVDEAVAAAFGGSQQRHSEAARRVADRYLRRKLRDE